MRFIPAETLTWLRFAAVALCMVTAAMGFAQQPLAKVRVTAGGHAFAADLADTPALQVRGLGGRSYLGPSDGMLFVYAGKSHHAFWMKDMLIPIDIIWLDNRHIVHIEHRVPPPTPNTPDSALRTYTPPRPANLVLEIAAGRARELKLTVGDLVSYDFSTR